MERCYDNYCSLVSTEYLASVQMKRWFNLAVYVDGNGEVGNCALWSDGTMHHSTPMIVC